MVKSGCIAILEASNYFENFNNGNESIDIRRTSSVDMSYRFKNEQFNLKDNFLEKPDFDQILGVNDDLKILHVVITSYSGTQSDL